MCVCVPELRNLKTSPSWCVLIKFNNLYPLCGVQYIFNTVIFGRRHGAYCVMPVCRIYFYASKIIVFYWQSTLLSCSRLHYYLSHMSILHLLLAVSRCWKCVSIFHSSSSHGLCAFSHTDVTSESWPVMVLMQYCDSPVSDLLSKRETGGLTRRQFWICWTSGG